MLYLPIIHHNMTIADAQSVLFTELNKHSITTLATRVRKKPNRYTAWFAGKNWNREIKTVLLVALSSMRSHNKIK